MKLGELIEKLGGKLTQGSAEIEISGVASHETADARSLIFADSDTSLASALTSKAAAVVLRRVPDAPTALGMVEADQPRLWFAQAAKLLRAEIQEGIHPTAVVDPTATLGRNVMIGAGAVIGDGVHIGDDSRIYPRVVIYPGARLGSRVVIHAGAILGADGFGYVRDNQSGAYTQFPQQGTLVIEDDVEIGANTTIDRGALAETRIRRGAKIDNLVHIGHNCDIGEDVVIAALTGISGSSSVGNGAVIAGQVGIGDHAHVGPGVILGGQAGVLSGMTVTNDGLKPGTVLWGTPARPLKQVLRELAALARLAKPRSELKRDE